MLKPLLILDLNGTLLHRLTKSGERALAKAHPKYQQASFTIRGSPCHLRPHLAPFMKFAREHFRVAMWTSAMPVNALPMVVWTCDGLLNLSEEVRKGAIGDVILPTYNPIGECEDLLFAWTQSECHTKATTAQKPEFIKDLSLVWARYPEYTLDNTFIVDDSEDKILDEHRPCHVLVEEFRVDLIDIDHTVDDALVRLQSVLKERIAAINEKRDKVDETGEKEESDEVTREFLTELSIEDALGALSLGKK